MLFTFCAAVLPPWTATDKAVPILPAIFLENRRLKAKSRKIMSFSKARLILKHYLVVLIYRYLVRVNVTQMLLSEPDPSQ